MGTTPDLIHLTGPRQHFWLVTTTSTSASWPLPPTALEGNPTFSAMKQRIRQWNRLWLRLFQTLLWCISTTRDTMIWALIQRTSPHSPLRYRGWLGMESGSRTITGSRFVDCMDLYASHHALSSWLPISTTSAFTTTPPYEQAILLAVHSDLGLHAITRCLDDGTVPHTYWHEPWLYIR